MIDFNIIYQKIKALFDNEKNETSDQQSSIDRISKGLAEAMFNTVAAYTGANDGRVKEVLIGNLDGINKIFNTTFSFVDSTVEIIFNGVDFYDFTITNDKEITFFEPPRINGFRDKIFVRYVRSKIFPSDPTTGIDIEALSNKLDKEIADIKKDVLDLYQEIADINSILVPISFFKKEVLIGNLDGINKIFNTTFSFVDSTVEIIFNGVDFYDFTITNDKEITFFEPPRINGFRDKIFVRYVRSK